MPWCKLLHRLPLPRGTRHITAWFVLNPPLPNSFTWLSESDDFCLACAVAQTNVGYSYICKTMEMLGIELSANYGSYVGGMKRKRDSENNRKGTKTHTILATINRVWCHSRSIFCQIKITICMYLMSTNFRFERSTDYKYYLQNQILYKH